VLETGTLTPQRTFDLRNVVQLSQQQRRSC